MSRRQFSATTQSLVIDVRASRHLVGEGFHIGTPALVVEVLQSLPFLMSIILKPPSSAQTRLPQVVVPGRGHSIHRGLGGLTQVARFPDPVSQTEFRTVASSCPGQQNHLQESVGILVKLLSGEITIVGDSLPVLFLASLWARAWRQISTRSYS